MAAGDQLPHYISTIERGRMLKRPQSALVVGAGVIGMATAYALARKGLSVTLVDREPRPGMGSSYANGAQLSYCYTDALATPAILPSLPALSLGLDKAFRLRAQWDLDYVYWLLAFLRNCTHQKFAANTAAALELAQDSCKAMAAMQNSHKIEFGHKVVGKMHVYSDEAQFRKAKALSEKKRVFGIRQEALSSAEAIRLEPALLKRTDPIAGVIYSPDDAVGNSRTFCTEMLKLLVTEYGVKTSFKTAISNVKLDQSAQATCGDGSVMSADIAILCTGSAASDLLAPHGVRIPVQPMKGYSFELPANNFSPKISITDSRRRIVFTNLGDRIRIAGLAELGSTSTRVSPKSMENLVETARQSLPDAGHYNHASNFWAGLRPMTPNSQPIISRPHDHLAINTGHGMLGWTMAMGSGEKLATLM
ncbi:FAD-dependent oxidoreductase [Parasphingorhabdus sp.]|uniref:FAD-dependent oxidoreductase n=1 Tax=Parasphingorhabdus sp. TaxID=2709688 RepID=UPI0032665CA6